MRADQINIDLRSDIRYFAFLVGNGSLLPDDIDFDYEAYLMRKDDALGCVFAVYLNNLHARLSWGGDHNPSHRAAQWLMHYCVTDYHVAPPFEPWELQGNKSTGDAFDAVKLFALLLGQCALEPGILDGVDYIPYLFNGGSFLESIFAVFTNVSRVNSEGHVLNATQAQRRAAQYIRQCIDKYYHAVPLFDQWELELV